MIENIFEYAARNKIRFQSSRGELTVEQLWDVPLRAAGNYPDFSLNTVAKLANDQVKVLNEENFVDTKRTSKHVRAEIALVLVKHVIDTKLEEENKAKKRADAKEEEKLLLQALANKQGEKFDSMTEAQIQKRLKALKEEPAEA